jgi:hypothetical protein
LDSLRSVNAADHPGVVSQNRRRALHAVPDGRIAEMFDVVYRNARGRLAELAQGLSAEQLRTPVAATPEWTVHELFAHVVGGAADVASGRLDGLPGDEWTARHVGERRHRPISELLAEWDCGSPCSTDTSGVGSVILV